MKTRSILSGWGRYLTNGRVPSVGIVGYYDDCWHFVGDLVQLDYELNSRWQEATASPFMWRVSRIDGSTRTYVFDDEIIFIL